MDKKAIEGMAVQNGIIKGFDRQTCYVWFPNRHDTFGNIMGYSWNEMKTEYGIENPEGMK